MAQNPSPDPIAWANSEVMRLRELWASADPPPTNKQRATIADLIPTVEFLKRYAGETSNFALHAIGQLKGSYSWANTPTMAAILQSWIEYEASGLQRDAPFEVRARVEAASDLMEQVGVLLEDRRVHPAAPIVLAGAALEERLRALMSEHQVALSRKPGLDTYGADLKKAKVLDGQEAKQVTAWAGLRNRAAHGQDLVNLTVEEARIMADGINLFLYKHALP